MYQLYSSYVTEIYMFLSKYVESQTLICNLKTSYWYMPQCAFILTIQGKRSCCKFDATATRHYV